MPFDQANTQFAEEVMIPKQVKRGENSKQVVNQIEQGRRIEIAVKQIGSMEPVADVDNQWC
jgi:hypothetical protein